MRGHTEALGASARVVLEEGERVDLDAVDRDLEVQVGSGRHAGPPDEPDEVADLHLIPDWSGLEPYCMCA